MMIGHWNLEQVGIFNPEDYVGFVYKITRVKDGKFYIGKKQFWSRRSKKVKGRKNRKWTTTESNWKVYTSSSKELKEEIKNNEDGFTFDIIHLCKTKRELGYLETKEQFNQEVLEPHTNSFNKNILGKYFKLL